MDSPHDSHSYMPSLATLSHSLPHASLPTSSPSPTHSPYRHNYNNHHLQHHHHLLHTQHRNAVFAPVHQPPLGLSNASPQFSQPSHDMQYQFQHPVTTTPPAPNSASTAPSLSPQPSLSTPRQRSTLDDPSSTVPPAYLQPVDASPTDVPSGGVLYGPPEGALATSYVGSYTLYGTIGEGAFGK